MCPHPIYRNLEFVTLGGKEGYAIVCMNLWADFVGVE